MFYIVAFTLLVYVAYRLYHHFFPAPNVDPRGKYVLISGCDTGFGNQLAIELDKEGFSVFAGVYSADSKSKLISQLSSRATVFLLDITRQQDIDSAYELVKAKTNILHALVNNAGVSTGGHVDWITMESIRQIMEINFFGHVAMTKIFLPLLIAKRDSRVVNICSVDGFISPPSSSAYCASKHALESFSDCLRREMFAWGLRVSVVEPGIMRTPIMQKHSEAMGQVRTKLPADVRERWGEEYFTNYYENLKNSIMVKYAEDPVKVVRAMRHAVTSTVPCTRYKPGWQSKYVCFPLSMLPTRLADIYFVKTSDVSVLPIGIKKQLN